MAILNELRTSAAPQSPALSSLGGKSRIGCLNFNCGGTANSAMPHFLNNVERDGNVFPFVNVLIDTDPSTFDNNHYDIPIFLKVTTDIINAIRGNFPLFSKHIEQILVNEARMLGRGDIGNGSRTTRCLSQFPWEYHQQYIRDQIRDACDRLVKEGVTAILPMISSSTGGGCGSATAVLLLQSLADPEFVSSIMLGHSGNLLLPCLMFAADPIVYARQKRGMQRKKILGNALAYREETDALIRAGAPCQYIFHIGYSNEFGTTIRTGGEMGQVLGNAIYAIERNYLNLKRDWVDGPDDAAATDFAKLTNSLSSNDPVLRNGVSKKGGDQ